LRDNVSASSPFLAFASCRFTTTPKVSPSGSSATQMRSIMCVSAFTRRYGSSIALTTRAERWPIAGTFTISRGAKTEAVTVVAEVSQSGLTGRGECVPYPRYGETPEETLKALQAMGQAVSRGLDRQKLQAAMQAGAARNALDCAFWDMDAKRAYRSVAELAATIAEPPQIAETRFRSNIAIDGVDAWEEQRWIGRTLRVGDVEFSVVSPKTRCLATHANPLTGERDRPIMTTLLTLFPTERPTFAVAMRSDCGGTLRIGDNVELT